MASAEREPITGVRGWNPSGVQGKSLVGARRRSLPEAVHFHTKEGQQVKDLNGMI